MIDWVGLTAAATTFFVVAASPGPATLAAATVSMSAGRRNGLTFGGGLSVGLAFWGVIAATGLGSLLAASAYALTSLKIAGGVYLLWLAYGSARMASLWGGATVSLKGTEQWFRRGLLLNLSNPKAVLAWMATLALGMGQNAGQWQVVWATLTCIAIGAMVYAVYALAFSTAGAMMIFAKFRRLIDGVAAALFAASGFALLRSAFTRQ